MKKLIWLITLLTVSCAILLLFPACAATVPEESDTSPVSEPPASLSVVQQTILSAEPDTVSVLQARDRTTDEMGRLRYLLYTPENPAEDMPLIVFLHGASGKGEDLELILSADDFPNYLQSGKLGDVQAYVLIPQLPSSQKGWSDMEEPLYDLIQETVSEFSIDEENISLAGFSMGGTETWNFAAAYPTLFARIAPLAGSARGVLDQTLELQEIPVWAFVGAEDTVIKPNSSKEMVFALKKAKGTASLTIFDSADHLSVPPLAWLDESIGLVDWLIGKAE